MKYILMLLIGVGLIATWFYVQNHQPIFKKQTIQPSLSVLDNEDEESECPLEGSAISEEVRALNIFKNRTAFPVSTDFDTSISLSSLLAEGNDEDRWQPTHAARIQGYVANVKPGGVETCNCKNKNMDDRDTHIELIINPNDNSETKRFIVEVTPRLRKLMKSKGINWSTRALRDDYLGRFVEIEGWLLFDKEHETQAENTNPYNTRNWRATAWEIHPITKIIKLEKNPNLFR